MNPSAPEWPPPVPSLVNFVEIAQARDAKWFARQYRTWIALSCLLSALLGVVWVYYFPPKYVSRATVRFLPPQVAGRFVNPNFSMEIGQRMFALSQLLGSRLTAAKLIESQSLYPERRRFLPVEDLTAKFIEDLSILQVGNAPGEDQRSVPTLRISFAYPDAAKAQKIVQKLVEQIYEENRKYRGDQSLGTTDFLLEQLNAAEEKVLESEQRLGEIQDSIGLTVSQTRMGQSTSRSYVIDSRLRDLRHDRRQQEERKSTKKAEWEQLELLQRRIETRPVEFYIPEFEGMQHYWTLRERVSIAKSRLERLKERYSSSMPDVISAENDVREVDAAVERFHKERGTRLRNRDLEGNASKIALARLELQALDKEAGEQIKEESELRAEAQRLREQQVSPAGQEVEMLFAKREYDAARDQHNEFLKKHEASRAASEMERRGQGESVELLEPASAPSEPERPTWWMRIAIAGLLGLLASSLCCLVKALRDPRILHGGHLESWAGLEVLANFAIEPAMKKRFSRAGATAISFLALLFASGCGRWTEAPAEMCHQGDAAEQAGNTTLAMLHYRRAIQKDAKYAPAYVSIGRIALKMGELVAAREALARAVELAPGQQLLVKQLAETSYQLYFGDPGRPMVLLREIESLGEKLKREWPRQPDGYRILAQVLMERHRTEDAIDLLEKACKTVERSESLRAQMAAALFRQNRHADSEAVLLALIEDRPQYLDAYDLLYLQLMQRKESGPARELLATKLKQTGGVEPALQLAAHEDAHGARDAAIQLLASVVPTAQKTTLGMARIGDFWLQRGQWKSAWDAYVQGSEAEPQRRAEYIGRLAEWHLAKGQSSDARALVEKEYAKDKSSLVLQAYLAAVRLGEVPADRRTGERIRLETILQKMPDSPFVRYHLGRAYLLEQNLQPAVEQFERAVKLDANYAAGWLALAELDLSQGNASAAEQHADIVLRGNPKHTRALILRARAEARRGKLAEAKSSLAGLVQTEPGNLDARYYFALASAGQGKSAEAATLLREGSRQEPENARWAVALSAVASRAGRLQDARQELETALAKTKQPEALLERLANVQIQMKDGAGARKSFEQLLSSVPQSFEYQLGLAGAMALAGDRPGALQSYTKLQQVKRDDLRVWLQPAALLGEMGRDQEARLAYEEALRLDRDNPFALNNLAWLLLRRNENPQQALELAQRARQKVRQSPEVDGTLAEAYTRLAMNRSAEAIYEEMLSYLPDSDKPRIEKLMLSVKKKTGKDGNS